MLFLVLKSLAILILEIKSSGKMNPSLSLFSKSYKICLIIISVPN